METLESVYKALAGKYSDNEDLIDSIWIEIKTRHSTSSHHYHNLSHLKHLYEELQVIKGELEDWDVVLYTLFFHDIVYNARSTKNEEKSAEMASDLLYRLGVPKHQINRCTAQILDTKGHNLSEDGDSNYFTDADLAILGQSWDRYQSYLEQIRREYKMFPDLLYKPGRKKVLKHFLSMDRIYKTSHFYEKYEQVARDNLQQELTLLT